MEFCVRALLMVTGIKLLLLPAYRSTDFEVHRNWLAITHSLPLNRWYVEATSPWTLDYPPLFAWFEWMLSHIAAFFDPDMLRVDALEYASPATVLFQRLSVIATDGVLAAAALAARRSLEGPPAAKQLAFWLVIANAGLLLVDHVHFQYNGVLLGILLWSVHWVQSGRVVAAAAAFAVLLNMKHLFAYAAPVYFVYMLRGYCMQRSGGGGGSGRAMHWRRFAALGAAVVAVFAASLGPFAAAGQLPQLLARLFPFGRGLTHAYWAGNAWALYAAGDKAAAAAARRLGVRLSTPAGHLATGAVGVADFAVLPAVGPTVSLVAVALALVPALVATWQRPHHAGFSKAVAYSNLCGFMFGYHVHEKAALTAVVPLAWAAVQAGGGKGEARAAAAQFLLLATAANYGLFPLLFRPQEYAAKLLLAALYSFAVWYCFFGNGTVAANAGATEGSARLGLRRGLSLRWWEAGYLLGFVFLEVFNSVVHPMLFAARLPFLPLLLTSIYCAAGASYVWASMAWSYVRESLSGSNSSSGSKKRD